jgi:endonuclease/exonuclease/phosphatase family metal-dependent hydrolase
VYVQTIVMRLRVLTWNLMHGRAQPPAHGDQRERFTSALESFEWDVALLQEVPPWWPEALGAALIAEYRVVLTSRNGLLAARRTIATRWPNLIKSHGGGANAILARSDRIVTDRALRLRLLPERRWVHGVRLAAGIWVANLHASGEYAGAPEDGQAAAAAALQWAGGDPVVLGGDFNQRHLRLDGLVHVARRDVDHIFVGQGLALVGEPEILERGTLSDHPPLAVTVQRTD